MAFNWGLARVKAVMDQRAAETTYGIAGDDLTPAISGSLYGLRKDWNAAKDTAAPWWPECSKEAFNPGLDQLARALKNWAGSRNGQRKGKPAGFPRFKSRRKAVKAKLLLSERTYLCAACGTVADRDRNAARNLAGYGKDQLAASGADSSGRGAGRKTGLARQVAAKRQPGTRQRGQTGTVPT